MEKLLNALRETLSQLGLDEEAIEAALKEAVKKAESEENPAEGDPAPDPTEDPVPPSSKPGEGEGGGEDPTVVEPQPGENPASEEEQPVPPTDPVPPAAPVPPVDLAPVMEKIANLQSAVDELKKANDGLTEQVESYKEALVKAGVIEGEVTNNQVGDGGPSLNPQDVEGNKALDDVLAKLNRK